jgi:flagellar motor protein MotB
MGEGEGGVMAKEKAQQEEESGGEGAPLWMISFADMMSLLMAFFLMLTTFSSFGPKEEDQLRSAIFVALAPYGGLFGYGVFESSGDDMSRGLNPTGASTENSEKRTFDIADLTRSKGALRPTHAPDFRTHKVFTAESKNMYWSTGTSLSTQGRTFLDLVAAYAKRLKGPLIVSESGTTFDDLGVQRAIAAVRYLVDHGVPEASINVAPDVLEPALDSIHRRLQVTFLAGAIEQ